MRRSNRNRGPGKGPCCGSIRFFCILCCCSRFCWLRCCYSIVPLNAASPFVVLCSVTSAGLDRATDSLHPCRSRRKDWRKHRGRRRRECRIRAVLWAPCASRATMLLGSSVPRSCRCCLSRIVLWRCLFDDRSYDDSVRVAESFVNMLTARGITRHMTRSARAQAAGAGFALQDADNLSMPRRTELQLARCESVQHSLASTSTDDPACALNPSFSPVVLSSASLSTPPRVGPAGIILSAQLQAHLLAQVIREMPSKRRAGFSVKTTRR